MANESFYGQPMKMSVIDIQIQKISADEAISFETDILFK